MSFLDFLVPFELCTKDIAKIKNFSAENQHCAFGN